MSIQCLLSTSDKDEWEKLGGFFSFPTTIEQCVHADPLLGSPDQGDQCVDFLHQQYTTECRGCMKDYQQCLAETGPSKCGTECRGVGCTSIANEFCTEPNFLNCTNAPRCITPDFAAYASSACRACRENNCNPGFRSCSGYSVEVCNTCIDPNAPPTDNTLIFIIGGVGGALALIAGLVVLGLRRSKNRGKFNVGLEKSYMKKLTGDGKPGKKKTGSAGYSTGPPIGSAKPKKLPPGLGYTQPPRPTTPLVAPPPIEREVEQEYPQFIVAFGFEAENVDELDAPIGTVVLGLSQIDENWWICQDQAGRQGMIPADFLREPEAEERVLQSSFAGMGGAPGERQETAIFVSPSGERVEAQVQVYNTDQILGNTGGNDDDEEPEF